jgi:acetate---CoA ligase (ADP-forming)
MSAYDFTRMFNPRGIAIVGANTDLTRPGRQTVLALERHGYKGGVYPVNPKYDEIGGRKCVRSLADIDGPCDVAVVALPAAHVPDVIEQCGRKSIGFAVVLGGGFREAGPEGTILERRMLDAARAGGVRIIGPNCLGFANIHDRVFASFGSITRPPDLEPGPVSALIQSGGYGNSIIIQAGQAGIGFRYLVASGAESDIKAPELIDAFIDDPKTRVIFAYLEGLDDGRAFMSAARHALAAGKPLVVVKAGNTRQGVRAAASHTAFMTGSYDVYKAAFKQCGAIEARDLGDAVDTLQSLISGRLARGRNVAVMSGSGGSLVSFSDAADDLGLTLAPLTEHTRAILRENLPSIAFVNNPVDCTAGFHKEANAPRFVKCIEALLEDPGIDQVGLFMATAAGENMRHSAGAVVQSRNPSAKPIFVFSALPPSMTVEGRATLKAASIPVLATPRRLAASMAMLADYSVARRRSDSLTAEHTTAARALPLLPAGAVTLDEHASKQILAGLGIPVTRDALLPADAALFRLPHGFKFPVAVKIVSRDIAHKTDIGAVKLNVTDDAQLAHAAAEVLANAKKQNPAASITGVLVSEMVTDALETIIGVVRDPVFGPVVAFGLGGVLAETLRDTTYRIAPFGLETAHEMIGELRASPIFAGLRGQPPRDVEALAKTLVNVSEVAWLMRDRLAEMDINPVLVRPAGLGVVAADALIVLQ